MQDRRDPLERGARSGLPTLGGIGEPARQQTASGSTSRRRTSTASRTRSRAARTITSGSWAALDPDTGKILWQTADPSHNAFGGGNALGPVSVANGIVYVPSMSGKMYALQAENGNILWSFDGGASVNAGAAIVDGVVYWGSGYAHLQIPGWTTSNKFYAFSPNGTCSRRRAGPRRCVAAPAPLGVRRRR